MNLALHTDFDDILQPFGEKAGEFFLAAALYHSHKISFAAAAHLAQLSLDDFAARLREHFGTGYWITDDTIREDINTILQQP